MREFDDADGTRWGAELITHGRTSQYLNPKVHKPILQFSCLDRRSPRRYTQYSPDDLGSLESLPEVELRRLLQKASPH